MSMSETVDRYDETIKSAEKQAEVFEGLDYVDEANRDIAKALAELTMRLEAVLRPERDSADGVASEPSPQRSPMRDRLDTLNRSQHQILRSFQELSERLAI